MKLIFSILPGGQYLLPIAIVTYAIPMIIGAAYGRRSC